MKIMSIYLEIAKEVEILRREENLSYDEAFKRVKEKHFGREEEEK